MHLIRRRSPVLSVLLVVTLVAAACGGEGQNAQGAQSDSAGTATGTATGGPGSMPGMSGMPGVPGMGQMLSGRMMADMEAHLRAMRGAAPDSLRRALPAHRQMVANMVAQMNREMSDMNMAADAAWTALVDSVRADLTGMPELSAEELARTMPDHRCRVDRLMTAHRGMVGSMSR